MKFKIVSKKINTQIKSFFSLQYLSLIQYFIFLIVQSSYIFISKYFSSDYYVETCVCGGFSLWIVASYEMGRFVTLCENSKLRLIKMWIEMPTLIKYPVSVFHLAENS